MGNKRHILENESSKKGECGPSIASRASDILYIYRVHVDITYLGSEIKTRLLESLGSMLHFCFFLIEIIAPFLRYTPPTIQNCALA